MRQINTAGSLFRVGMIGLALFVTQAKSESQKADKPHFAYMLPYGDSKIFEFRMLSDGTIASHSFASTPSFGEGGDCTIDPSGRFLLVSYRGGITTYRIHADGHLGTPCAITKGDLFSNLLFSPLKPDILYSIYRGGNPSALSTFRLLPNGKVVRLGGHFRLRSQKGSQVYEGIDGMVIDPTGQFVYATICRAGAGSHFAWIASQPLHAAPEGSLSPWTPKGNQEEFLHSEAGAKAIAISADGKFVYDSNIVFLGACQILPDHTLKEIDGLYTTFGASIESPDGAAVLPSRSGHYVYKRTNVSNQIVTVQCDAQGHFVTEWSVYLHADGTLEKQDWPDPNTNPDTLPAPPAGPGIMDWTYSPDGRCFYLSTSQNAIFVYRVGADDSWTFLRAISTPGIQPGHIIFTH